MKVLIFIVALWSCQMVVAQDGMFAVCPLKVGAEIPAVSLSDQDNNVHSLLNLTSEKPTVIVFYRGAWCGYCTSHLAELNDAKAAIDSMGYQIFGITVDQSSKLEESKKRAESEIPVYSDANIEAIKAFGLDWNVGDELFTKYKEKYQLDLEEWSGQKHHALPVPAVFIVKDGIVQFQYVNPNYNTRLKATTLLAILETF